MEISIERVRSALVELSDDPDRLELVKVKALKSLRRLGADPELEAGMCVLACLGLHPACLTGTPNFAAYSDAVVRAFIERECRFSPATLSMLKLDISAAVAYDLCVAYRRYMAVIREVPKARQYLPQLEGVYVLLRAGIPDPFVFELDLIQTELDLSPEPVAPPSPEPLAPPPPDFDKSDHEDSEDDGDGILDALLKRLHQDDDAPDSDDDDLPELKDVYAAFAASNPDAVARAKELFVGVVGKKAAGAVLDKLEHGADAVDAVDADDADTDDDDDDKVYGLFD